MLETVPWFIGGGAEHSPAVARMLAYSATGGTNGVAAALDLRVQPLDIPGTSVTVMPGGAIILNAYPGGGQQTYIARNMSATDVPIPPTGSSSGAVLYVILRVDDPEFGAAVPADAVEGPYNRFTTVTSITNLNYPFVPLAKITMPASTGTITGSMITDLRKIANPRTERDMRLIFPTADRNMSKTGYTSWPFATTMTNIDGPSWATKLDIVAHVSGAEITGSGISFGGVRTKFDGVATAQNGIVRGGVGRHSFTLIGSHPVSATQRGKVLTLALEGYQTGGTGLIQADYQTSVAVDWVFTEVPA